MTMTQADLERAYLQHFGLREAGLVKLTLDDVQVRAHAFQVVLDLLLSTPHGHPISTPHATHPPTPLWASLKLSTGGPPPKPQSFGHVSVEAPWTCDVATDLDAQVTGTQHVLDLARR